MEGEEKAYEGLRLNERRAHGLCLFGTNQEVTYVTRSLARGKGKYESTREAQEIKSS